MHEALKERAIGAVDNKWLIELKDNLLGFINRSLVDILQHLRDCGGSLDYINTNQLKKERDYPWDNNKHIVKNIVKVQKAVDTLEEQTNITTDKGELLNDLLYMIKESGEMEQALVNYDTKDAADKVCANAKIYLSK